MSISVNCDRCQGAISADVLASGQALEYRGQHFCPSCKKLVVAALKKRKQAAAGGSAAAGKESANPLAKKAAKRVARQSKKPAAKKAPGRGRRATETRSSDRSTESAAPRAKSPQGSRPSAPPAARRSPVARPSLRERRAAEKKSSHGLLIGVIVGGVLIIGGLAYVLLTGGGDPAESAKAGETAGSSIASPAATELVEPKRTDADIQGEWIRGLAKEVRENPEGVLAIEEEIWALQEAEVVAPLQSQVDELVHDFRNAKNQLAQTVYDDVLARSRALQEELKFNEAAELWDNPATHIETSPIRANWEQERQYAARYADAARNWEKIFNRTKRYVAQKDTDIAIAILEENIPRRYAGDFPIIWKERQAILEKLRSEEAGQIVLLSEIERNRREEKEKQEKELRDQERLERFERLSAGIAWVPQVSRSGDLENWYKTTDYRAITNDDIDPFPWKNTSSDGERGLSADNTAGAGPIHIGQNGNRWLDWILEFELRVNSGSLKLETRAWVETQGQGRHPRVTAKANETFDFDSTEYSSWKKVEIRVFGSTVHWMEHGAEGLTLKTELKVQEPERGGYRFVLAPGGACDIRGLGLKLVNVLNEGEERASEFKEEFDEDEEGYGDDDEEEEDEGSEDEGEGNDTDEEDGEDGEDG